jgi:ribosome-binding factor A
MPWPGHRSERLADQIRMEVAEMIEGELKDPRIGFATVTRVELSPDMRYGRIMVSVMEEEAAQQETLAGLAAAAGFIRRELAQRLRLRRAPELVFVLDRETEEAERVERLLKDIQQES